MQCSALHLRYIVAFTIEFVAIFNKIFSFPQEYVAFNPDLLDKTEPLIKEDWKETDFLLPFEGFTKDAYPKVNS